MSNSVYIATSLDGYIADKNGGIDWLDVIPNPEESDLGYFAFIENIDALVMGRKSFEKVLSFGIPWPYTKPVFVLSSSLKTVPLEVEDKAHVVSGEIKGIVEELHSKGFKNLYIDGGVTIQGFLEEDLIDELIITRLPIVLGDGIPLFAHFDQSLWFEHVHTEVLLNELVKSHYRRKRA